MTVILGQYGASGDAGWTTITASGTPQDGFNTGAPATTTTMIIHVSSSTGKDSGDGGFNANIQGSSAQPYRTIAAGKAKMRGNPSGSPDWLLLRKGDVWNETFGLISFYGISADEPAVISSYDPSNPNTPNPSTGGARPLLKVDDAVAGGQFVVASTGSAPNGMKYCAIIGLEVYFYKRDAENNSAQFNASDLGIDSFRPLTAFQWLLVEDCKVTYGGGGITPTPFQNLAYNAIVRRNIIANSWGIYPHGPQRNICGKCCKRICCGGKSF